MVEPAFLTDLLARLIEKVAPDAPVTMSFKRASFASGHDLQEFASRMGIALAQEHIEQ